MTMNQYVTKLPPGSASLITQRDAVGPMWSGEEELTPEQVAAYVAEYNASLPRKQATRTVLDRLTAPELAALHAAGSINPAAWAWVQKAITEGAISEADPDFASARLFLDVNNIIAENRWDELLAP